jgi:hypothetical protein
MQQGELIVVGKDEAHISLRSKPFKVECRFVDEKDIPVPCNPHQEDKLECEVRFEDGPFHRHRFMLVIKWEVEGERAIKWTVYY